MLRGALGHALLRFAPLPHRGQEPCALYGRCPYCTVFLAPPQADHHLKKLSQLPPPFVIEPPPGGQKLQAGQSFQFALLLFGQAIPLWATVLQALASALQTGLGDSRSPCHLQTAWHEQSGQTLWPGSGQALGSTVLPPISGIDKNGSHAVLRFFTPLRLKRQGRPIRQAADLHARILLIALARRYQLLLDAWMPGQVPQLDFEQLTKQARGVQLQVIDMRWLDWGRYSQRQQREMKFGGLLGSVQLQGRLQPFARLLHLGQWLHVGGKTTFGLGGYQLSDPVQASA